MPLFRVTWNQDDTEVVEQGDVFDVIVYILEEWAEARNVDLIGVASFIAERGEQPVIPEAQIDPQTPVDLLVELAHQASDLIIADVNLEALFLNCIDVGVEPIDVVEQGDVLVEMLAQ